MTGFYPPGLTSPQEGFWTWVPVIRDPDTKAQLADIHDHLSSIDNTLGVIMTALEDFNASVALWVDYAATQKAIITDLQAQLEQAVATVQQLIDTDATEDAAQAEALAAELSAQLAAALEGVKNPPVEPPPVEEPPVEEPPVEEPPVEEPPVVVEDPPVVVDPPFDPPVDPVDPEDPFFQA